MALETEEMIVERITTVVGGERILTIFAAITFDVVTSIQCDDSHGFFLTGVGQNGSMTGKAPWSEFLMKTIDTMNLHVGIDSKWNTVETLFTSDAAKALSMKRFARCTKNLKSIVSSIRLCSILLDR